MLELSNDSEIVKTRYSFDPLEGDKIIVAKRKTRSLLQSIAFAQKSAKAIL